jgi:ATP-dependent RNA helicase DDX18/HAS1
MPIQNYRLFFECLGPVKFSFFCVAAMQIMVFFSSCNSVKFHSELLNYIDIPCLDIHGKQKQQKRTSTYFEFCNAEKGILLCTDVAARGLDIPAVVCLRST